jgi:hypothetical protein
VLCGELWKPGATLVSPSSMRQLVTPRRYPKSVYPVGLDMCVTRSDVLSFRVWSKFNAQDPDGRPRDAGARAGPLGLRGAQDPRTPLRGDLTSLAASDLATLAQLAHATAMTCSATFRPVDDLD